MGITNKQKKRPEREAVKRAKVAISVAALTITVGGWISLHASENALTPPLTTASQVAGPGSAQGNNPAPITTTRSSR